MNNRVTTEEIIDCLIELPRNQFEQALIKILGKSAQWLARTSSVDILVLSGYAILDMNNSQNAS